MSDYDRRYDAAMRELEATDIWEANYAPPLLVLLRGLGRKPVPPHYMRFWHVVATYGPSFAIVWGTIMWFLRWSEIGMHPVYAIAAAAITGLIFGLAMAFAYWRVRRKWTLSEWSDL